jgi:hypothetical protein
MMTRIRGQLGRDEQLQAAGELRVSATAVPVPVQPSSQSLAAQVQEVAEHVTEMIASILARERSGSQETQPGTK